jgi:hypothetical protein
MMGSANKRGGVAIVCVVQVSCSEYRQLRIDRAMSTSSSSTSTTWVVVSDDRSEASPRTFNRTRRPRSQTLFTPHGHLVHSFPHLALVSYPALLAAKQ